MKFSSLSVLFIPFLNFINFICGKYLSFIRIDNVLSPAGLTSI